MTATEDHGTRRTELELTVPAKGTGGPGRHWRLQALRICSARGRKSRQRRRRRASGQWALPSIQSAI